MTRTSAAARVVEVWSIVPAPREQVWARVASAEGIDHELRPWLSMSLPKGTESLDASTLPVGQPLGKAWLRLFGVLPVDYDDLTVVALEGGRHAAVNRFHEVSSMMSARRWEHERTLSDAHVPGLTAATEVHDRLTIEPRFGARVVGPVVERIVRALFQHRHRRLASYFAGHAA